MGRISILFVLAWIATGLAAVHAERLYKWTDDQGNVSYHDQPPPDDAGYRVEEKDLGAGKKPAGDDTLAKIEEKYPVTLYSVPSCGSCDLARTYLKKRQVPFTEHNLENDVDQQQKLKKKTGSLSVPTITIGSKVMKGYVESVLEGELDDAGYPKIKTPPSGENKDQANAPDSGS
ncbi:MAG: glutaredoxin domain-containing protein [Sulfuricaulis sp.]